MSIELYQRKIKEINGLNGSLNAEVEYLKGQNDLKEETIQFLWGEIHKHQAEKGVLESSIQAADKLRKNWESLTWAFKNDLAALRQLVAKGVSVDLQKFDDTQKRARAIEFAKERDQEKKDQAKINEGLGIST